MTTKPSVGRTVHFFTTDPAKQFNGQGAGPYPAVVLQVFSTDPAHDTMANLKVSHWGGSYDEGSVYEHMQGRLNGCFASWWVWPPRGE